MKTLKFFPRGLYPTLSLILFILLCVLGVMYVQAVRLKQKNANPEQPAIAKIRSIMTLPTETPTITYITDVQKAKQQNPSFFLNAKGGEMIISYSSLALLYDEKQQKIIGIQTKSAPLPTPSTPLQISIRYNKGSKARAETLRTQLSKESINYTISEFAQSNVLYPEDIMYLVNTSRDQDISTLATAIGGSDVKKILDPQEKPTSADVIIAFADKPE
ncbi:MAG: hypothetical protein AAB557_04365 [Patescibacteria group bacterium]